MQDIQTKIQCDGCGKKLMKLRFSTSAQNKYFASLEQNRRNSRNKVKLPRCLACNPQNRSEMTCVMCGNTKSLEAFAKAQRKKTDDAHCRDCQQEKDDREPDHEKEVEEVKIMDEMRQSNLGFSTNSYFSSAVSRVQPSRLSQAQSDRFETDTNPGSSSWAHGNEAVSLSGSDYSGVPSQGIGYATGTGWDVYGGGDRAHGAPSGGSKTSGGFVKQNAVAKDKYQKAREQIERERNRREQEEEKLQREDSDDGSDADDDPY